MGVMHDSVQPSHTLSHHKPLPMALLQNSHIQSGPLAQKIKIKG